MNKNISSLAEALNFARTTNTALETVKTECGVHGRVLLWHPDGHIDKLRKKYWRALSEIHYLKHIIESKQNVMEELCQHAWEYEADRDERTHYTCKHCGKYR